MSFYKWIFRKLTGVQLVDPDPNFVPEENDAELYLENDPNWPKTVSGVFSLIDSSGDDEHEFYWAIGELEISGFKDSILIEFRDSVLIQSGFNKLMDFPDHIDVIINPAVQEYYQVLKCEQT